MRIAARLLLVTALLCVTARGESYDLSTELALEGRVFPSPPGSSVQRQYDISASIEPKFTMQWENRRQTFEASPFFRYDAADSNRTHFDMANFSYVKAWDHFELRAGIRKVFWGVTESQHLVDIINQSDLVEDFRGYTKLGQPMVNAAAITDFGSFEAFVMPYFRERTFPGPFGHFRPPTVINTNAVTYQSSNGRWNPDLAFRWSDRIGIFDLGISHFYGTNRQPDLIPVINASGTAELDPYYSLIQQTGLDAQMTLGSFLGKLEMITHGDQRYQNAYFASTVGGEYTFPRVFHSTLDVGLLLEYLYDSRGTRASTAYQDDIFLGLRFTLNDSGGLNFLAGEIFDRATNNQIFLLEASRRFGSHWKLSVSGGLFNINNSSDPLYAYYRDSYLQTTLTYFFL